MALAFDHETPRTRRLGYQPSLDGIRCVAVSLVLILHAMAFLLPTRFQGHFQGAGIGVDIFFVLSGFLITTLLFEEADRRGRIAVGAFYVRRALRLLPALVALLVVNSIIVLTLDRVSPRRVLTSDLEALLYVVNWVKTFGPDVVPGLGHTWTLAVEEQFYLAWPWLVILALRRRLGPGGIALILIAGIALSATTRAILWARAGGDWESIAFRTDTNADTLLAGALLAVARRQGWSALPRWSPLAAVIVLASVVLALGDSKSFLMYGGYTIVAVASAVLIAGVLDESPVRCGPIAQPLQHRAARHVGQISYGLYLWHVPMFNLAAFHLRLPPSLKPVVGVGLAIAAAELSMKLIERPFLKLKKRAGETQPGKETTRALEAGG